MTTRSTAPRARTGSRARPVLISAFRSVMRLYFRQIERVGEAPAGLGPATQTEAHDRAEVAHLRARQRVPVRHRHQQSVLVVCHYFFAAGSIGGY